MIYKKSIYLLCGIISNATEEALWRPSLNSVFQQCNQIPQNNLVDDNNQNEQEMQVNTNLIQNNIIIYADGLPNLHQYRSQLNRFVSNHELSSSWLA